MSNDPSDAELRDYFAELGFITCSPTIIPVLRRAQKAAKVSDVTVLLEGETGTGKQVLAQAIHKLDQKRSAFGFVTVHCSTISEALAESELFGHQRGAFSGAVQDRKGLFQSAHRGTLFLDDVNDLPGNIQPKLLDVIQRAALRPVGSDREISVDVRIIAACNQPLEPLVREGRFRADLYHRLNVVKLSLPPLRERNDDMASLILSFAKRHDSLYGQVKTVEPELLGLLRPYTFPGNVRELENAVQRMLFLKTEGSSLGVADWLAQSGSDALGAGQDLLAEAAASAWKAISQRGISYAETIQGIERRLIETAVNIPGCTRRQMAQRLRTSERTLYYKMRTHRIQGPGA
ncbi:MAG TPA: sigma 54-interacting transcriptional regulator [Candidatus Bathyarchaeia archaeon]|nr:sigma 54-interacting transcriptional regulator [Candidatus Bathyarchaeia archaeon]